MNGFSLVPSPSEILVSAVRFNTERMQVGMWADEVSRLLLAETFHTFDCEPMKPAGLIVHQVIAELYK